MPSGEDSERKELYHELCLHIWTPSSYIQNITLSLSSPWLQNLGLSPSLLLWHQCPSQELREAALAHVLEREEK